MKPFVIIFCLAISQFVSANTDITQTLEKAIYENVKQMKDESIEGTMATIHSQSNLYSSTKSIITRLFDMYDLEYNISSIKFIAHEDELAYVRVKQITKKVSGPTFKNNELDMLQIFKQEKGQWKIWSQANMSVVFLDK